MNTLRALVIATFVATALGQTDCGQGELVSDCCVCYTGWDLGPDGSCSVCAKGFVYDEDNDICSNGRAGSACTASLAYPYFGCTVNRQQIGTCSSGGVFPCVCDGGNCETSAAATYSSSECYPTGTRMYTPFPNQPVVGNQHSLTFVGCQLASTDVYAVIPAYTENLSAERRCSSLAGNSTGGVPSECMFSKKIAVIGGNATCTGKNGFLITGLNGHELSGLNEFTFEGITMYESVFGGSLQERAKANSADDGIDEKEAYFRVCKLTTVMSAAGTNELAWAEVANHDFGVSERDFIYKISKTALYDPFSAAAADGEGGDSCCDGLKLGPLCLPLWVFLLLWLLMACCLGAMGFMLHKNKNEIEAQKNNEKYEKFNVDAEMSAMAAKQAEDDDDI